uniref:HSP17.8 n=1 Tax=Selenicereus monacanthus TaxID=1195128 RepID=A0AA50CIM8_9CARY|nr:HSP17.8 [Selenicereus monacanthus]
MSLLSTFFDNPSILEPYFKPIAGDEFDTNYASMNWRETKDAHIYELELPGLTKDDVQLELHEGNVLRISAKRKEEDELESKKETWHCKERPRGGFSRQFRLPEEARVDEIKASMSNGVLVVTVPKDQELIKRLKKGKHNHHHRKVVVIEGVDGEEERHGVKGLGRFVCCKA